MVIRRLAPDDVPAYRALMLDAYARHPDAFTSTAQERASLPLAWWEARVAHDPNAMEVVLGAIEDDRIAGVAGLSFETRTKTRHKATLFGMYVPQAFRERGIGAALVHAALDYARSRPHVRLVQLTVSEGNHAARALYERCGFVAYGTEPCAMAMDGRFVAKVHMWCDLRGAGS